MRGCPHCLTGRFLDNLSSTRRDRKRSAAWKAALRIIASLESQLPLPARIAQHPSPAVTFYVQKRLALGSIRFGVSVRQPLTGIDDDPSLSTGAAGELLLHKREGFFFADTVPVVSPVLPTTKLINATPFLDSLKPDGTRRAWGFLALMAGGILFLLLGLAVLLRKGAAGWVEIILGIAMIVTPIVLTAQRRKLLREAEERQRAEREALEARNRKMLTDYTVALERVRTDRSDEALALLERERSALTLPYEIWGASARDSVLRVGFEELAKRGVAGAGEITQVLDRVSSAARLTTEDARTVKRDLYETVVWHLLADDRLGLTQEAQLSSLRQGLGMPADEVSAVEQFRRLRDLDAKSLHTIDCGLPLAYGERCVHRTATSDGPLFITSKRLVLGARKPIEVELPKIDDITVDADASAVVIRADNAKKPLSARVEDPIYTAAVIDLAGTLDTTPKGLA